MKLDLQDIPRVKGISEEEFLKEYFIPGKPVVFEDLSADWPATKKWDFEYFKRESGRHRRAFIRRKTCQREKEFSRACEEG